MTTQFLQTHMLNKSGFPLTCTELEIMKKKLPKSVHWNHFRYGFRLGVRELKEPEWDPATEELRVT